VSIPTNLSALASLLTGANTEKALLRQAFTDKGIDMSDVPFSLYHTKLAMLTLPSRMFSFTWSGESATLDLSRYILMSNVNVTAVGGGNTSVNGGAGGMVSAQIAQANAAGALLTISAGAAGGASTITWSAGSIAANAGSAPTGGSGSVSGTASHSIIKSADGTNATTGTNRVCYSIFWTAGTIVNNSPFAATLTYTAILISSGCVAGGSTLSIAANSSNNSLASAIAAGVYAIVGTFTVPGTADGTITTSQISVNAGGAFTVYRDEPYSIPASSGTATFTKDGTQYGAGGTSGDGRSGCVVIEFTGVADNG
jgi:hypothetical protein